MLHLYGQTPQTAKMFQLHVILIDNYTLLWLLLKGFGSLKQEYSYFFFTESFDTPTVAAVSSLRKSFSNLCRWKASHSDRLLLRESEDLAVFIVEIN